MLAPTPNIAALIVRFPFSSSSPAFFIYTGTNKSSLAEGFDWWCEDPSTTCCFGSQLWQCIPRTAEECCTTGFYCPSGSHCFLGVDTVQYCLVPEEEEEQASHPNDFKPSQTAVQAEAAQTGAADTTEEDSGSSSGGKSSGGKSSGGKSSGGKKGGKSSSLKSSGIKLNAPAAAFFGLAVAAFW